MDASHHAILARRCLKEYDDDNKRSGLISWNGIFQRQGKGLLGSRPQQRQPQNFMTARNELGAPSGFYVAGPTLKDSPRSLGTC